MDTSSGANGATANGTFYVAHPPASPPPPRDACDQTLSSAGNLSSAVASAGAGSTICLESGSYGQLNLSGISKSSYTTLRSAPGARASFAGIATDDISYVRLQGLEVTAGGVVVGNGHDLIFDALDIGNQRGGYFVSGEAYGDGGHVRNLTISRNSIHNIDYAGPQNAGDGYGIQLAGAVDGVTITDNTIRSVAEDSIQANNINGLDIERNTFLGPGRAHPAHPQAHADLLQIFAGGSNITFKDNVARRTNTDESLLFQEGRFSNVVVDNNLFDHSSDGYDIQIYNAARLTFTNNTVVGSFWGSAFRDETGRDIWDSGPIPAGSNYRVNGNIFADTRDPTNSDFGTDTHAVLTWGDFTHNVCTDSSCPGEGLDNWQPRWVDTTHYEPVGLPFGAGYRRDR